MVYIECMTRKEIRAAVRLSGWTKQGLAKAAGLHRNALNQLYADSWNPTAETMERISDVLEGKMQRAGESPAPEAGNG